MTAETRREGPGAAGYREGGDPGGGAAAWARVAAVAAAVASLAALASAPFWLSEFRLQLLGKYLALALVTVSVDLVWGYGGMLCLGQGVFFGLGAYALAMFLKLEASGEWLPDFMSWSGLSELPGFWRPFASFPFAVASAILAPALLAGGLGYLVFRQRVRGPYFAIITQALALIATTLLVGQQPYTGGTNGITDFSTLLGHPLDDPRVQRVLYYATAGALVGSLLFARWLMGTSLGRLLIAVREGENRVRFSGYDPARIKAGVFALAAAMAGLGGALFVPQVGIISPAMIGVVPSIEMVVWVALGGRGTLFGAVAGALLVNLAKTYLSEAYASGWLYLYGLLLVAVVAAPGGLAGLLQRLARAGPRRPGAAPAGAAAREAGLPGEVASLARGRET